MVSESLPDDWSSEKLDALATIKYGKGLPTKNLTEEGYPVFGANGIIGKYPEFLYEEEQVLISCRGAYSGKINFSPKQCYVTNNSLVLELPEKPQVAKKYLYYALEAADKSKIVTGSAQPQVTINNAKELIVPVAPRDQQERIVAEIEKQFSRLDEAVASLKRVKANLKRYKAAVLKAAVEGKLTEEWRKQNPDVEPASKLLDRILAERRTKWEEAELAKMKAKGKEPKDDKWKEKYKPPPTVDTEYLPELPRGWAWSNLEQMAEAIPHALKAGPFGSALKKSFYVEKGYKIYGQEQVIRGDAYYGDYYIDEDRYQSLVSCAVKPGDLLISLVGTIGRVLILPDDIEPGIINPRLVKVSLDYRVIFPEFLSAYLGSPLVKAIFSIASHGGTMDVLNLTILKSVPIPVPPKGEQQFIFSEIEQIETLELNLEQNVSQSLQRGIGLRSSVLKDAFGGALGSYKSV